MEILLLVAVVLAGLWDGFTTVYGTTKVLGTDPIQLAASLLFSTLVMAFLLNTRRILGPQEALVGFFARIFWTLALFYGLYTSWIGNSDLILPNRATLAENVILTGLTILVSGSTILLPFLWERQSSPSRFAG